MIRHPNKQTNTFWETDKRRVLLFYINIKGEQKNGWIARSCIFQSSFLVISFLTNMNEIKKKNILIDNLIDLFKTIRETIFYLKLDE